MSDDTLISVYIPPLVFLLAHHERAKGAPLTRDEVLAIRDDGVCMMLRRSAAMQMAAQRGYDDIDPEFAWEDWQAVRDTLPENQEPA
ncbi:MAG TPA: hypothetical protein VEY93_09605 [Longimicrobium sp.]|nr:hypothetical protein [Longimicrobium sp.]